MNSFRIASQPPLIKGTQTSTRVVNYSLAVALLGIIGKFPTFEQRNLEGCTEYSICILFGPSSRPNKTNVNVIFCLC